MPSPHDPAPTARLAASAQANPFDGPCHPFTIRTTCRNCSLRAVPALLTGLAFSPPTKPKDYLRRSSSHLPTTRGASSHVRPSQTTCRLRPSRRYPTLPTCLFPPTRPQPSDWPSQATTTPTTIRNVPHPSTRHAEPNQSMRHAFPRQPDPNDVPIQPTSTRPTNQTRPAPLGPNRSTCPS